MTCLKPYTGELQRWEERQAQKTLGSLPSALHIDHALKQHHHSFGTASTAYRQDLSYSGNEYAATLCADQGHFDLVKIDPKSKQILFSLIKAKFLHPSLQCEIKSAPVFTQNFQWADRTHVREGCAVVAYQVMWQWDKIWYQINIERSYLYSSPVLILSLSRSWYGKHHLAWLPTPCSTNWTRQLPNINSCRNGSW